MAERNKTTSNLRHVPSVDQLLRTDAARELRETIGLKRKSRDVTPTLQSYLQAKAEQA